MDRDDESDEPSATRHDLAEDRTLLANERTFAGWMRTSLGCVGLAVAFNALFGALEPSWVPKGIASLFLLLAIFIAFTAVRRASVVRLRIDQHLTEASSPMNLTLIAVAISLGACCLGAAFWLIRFD